MERDGPVFQFAPIDSAWSSCGAGSGRIAQAGRAAETSNTVALSARRSEANITRLLLARQHRRFRGLYPRSAFAARPAAWQARRASPHRGGAMGGASEVS